MHIYTQKQWKGAQQQQEGIITTRSWIMIMRAELSYSLAHVCCIVVSLFLAFLSLQKPVLIEDTA